MADTQNPKVVNSLVYPYTTLVNAVEETRQSIITTYNNRFSLYDNDGGIDANCGLADIADNIGPISERGSSLAIKLLFPDHLSSFFGNIWDSSLGLTELSATADEQITDYYSLNQTNAFKPYVVPITLEDRAQFNRLAICGRYQPMIAGTSDGIALYVPEENLPASIAADPTNPEVWKAYGYSAVKALKSFNILQAASTTQYQFRIHNLSDIILTDKVYSGKGYIVWGSGDANPDECLTFMCLYRDFEAAIPKDIYYYVREMWKGAADANTFVCQANKKYKLASYYVMTDLGVDAKYGAGAYAYIEVKDSTGKMILSDQGGSVGAGWGGVYWVANGRNLTRDYYLLPGYTLTVGAYSRAAAGIEVEYYLIDMSNDLIED